MLRILHLEDSRADAELVHETLAAEDITCDMTVVATRDDFVAALERGGFNLILADYNLPSFDGISALALAREKCPDTPFVFLSGTLGEELAIETLKSGATDYVLKQRLSRLVPSVRRALLEAQERAERKRAEEGLRQSNGRLVRALADLQQTQQQIVQQERLRALGEMASGVAHDFNNALAKILGFNELLLTSPERLSNPDSVKQYLQMINTAAQDAANVVRRLREFYRKRRETETFEPVNLNQLVEQAVSLTQPKWKQQTQASGITVAIHTDLREVPPVGGNEADLREVLTNLIFNAVDAMPKGGTITIRTRREGEQVVLEVSDTGTGMTEEVRRRCLEPFFSTKGERGTGLGLAIVYGILQRHGGSVDIESEVGKGTTFVIRLSRYTGQQAAPAKQQTETVSRPLHVLVVDDDPLLRDIEAEYLSSDGHTVETASNGSEALQKMRWKQFDLLMADRAMPQMNGDQLASAVKQLAPHVPVILVTGFADMMKSGGDKPAGVDLVVPKPFTQANLREAVLKVTELSRN